MITGNSISNYIVKRDASRADNDQDNTHNAIEAGAGSEQPEIVKPTLSTGLSPISSLDARSDDSKAGHIV